MQCVSGVITSHPEEEDEEGHLFWSENMNIEISLVELTK